MPKKKTIGTGEKWSIEQIKEGIELYLKEYNRYPTAHDFDDFEYLPSSRTIQRSHGGLEKLRTELGIEVVNYTKGDVRSRIASRTFKRAQDDEENFYDFLIKKVDEIKVHEHKILRPGRVCCDFFIYKNGTQKNGVIIDLFYAQEIRSLMSVVRIKSKRYASLKGNQIYFISVGNENIRQETVDSFLNNKKIKLQDNIRVITEDYFKVNFNDIVG